MFFTVSPKMKNENKIDINKIIAIAKEAGNLIMHYYNAPYNIQTKQDDSPVTDADFAANNYIISELKKLQYNIPIISEENDPAENFLEKPNEKFWLIDPIDGTRGFINKDDQFTVNIALIDNFIPIIGVIYAPSLEELYYSSEDKKAFMIDKTGKKIQISTRKIQNNILDILTSKGNDKGIDQIINNYQVNSIKKVGSSLKLCYVAKGIADCYPRQGLTMEWDTASGHAIILAAGGDVVNYDNQTLKYGKSDFKNPPFIAFGKR